MITREIAEATHPTKPLGEVAAFLDHKRRPVKQSERKEGIFPYYGANGLQGTIDSFIFDEPLILLAEDGGHFDDPDRGIAYEISGKTWVNNHAHVLKPQNGELDLTYLRRVLENYDVRPFINGSTRSKLTKAQAERIPIPLPPLDEQRRIAAILDKADALRRKRKRALELLDSLTQPVFLEMFGDPVGSAEYKPEAMGGAILAIESGWSPTCLDRAAMVGEAGVLKLSAVTTSEYAWKENKALPTGLRPKANTEVVAGDILFCRKNTRELVGSSVYVWNTRPHLYMSDLIFRLVPETSRINPIFLQAQISLPSQRRKISEMSGGAAGSMPNVSKAKLRDLQIIIPRLETQMEFARIVQSYRASWAHHAQSLKYSDFLFSSLQSRAFSGQL